MLNSKTPSKDIHKVFNLANLVFPYLNSENVLLFIFIILDSAILAEMQEDLNTAKGQDEYKDYFVYILNKFNSILEEQSITTNLLVDRFL